MWTTEEWQQWQQQQSGGQQWSEEEWTQWYQDHQMSEEEWQQRQHRKKCAAAQWPTLAETDMEDWTGLLYEQYQVQESIFETWYDAGASMSEPDDAHGPMVEEDCEEEDELSFMPDPSSVHMPPMPDRDSDSDSDESSREKFKDTSSSDSDCRIVATHASTASASVPHAPQTDAVLPDLPIALPNVAWEELGPAEMEAEAEDDDAMDVDEPDCKRAKH